jgi:hypothetical protein
MNLVGENMQALALAEDPLDLLAALEPLTPA